MTEDGLFVCKSPTVNVWADEWDDEEDWSGGGAKSRRLVPRGPFLGATVWELDPGRWVIYHAHHGSEELLFVLRGRPTLRTPEGERELAPGDVAFFPKGPDGAHQIVNRSDEPALYVIAANHVSPEVVEHVDSGKVLAMSRIGPLWPVHRRADAVDYFDGEEARG